MSIAAESDTRANIEKGSFVRVPTAILRCLDKTPVSLFMPHSTADHYVLFREAGYGLSRERAATLAEQCGDLLHVRASDYRAVSNELSNVLDRVIADDAFSSNDCFAVMQTAAALEIEESIRRVQCDKFVSLTFRIGHQITSIIERDDLLADELFSIVRHDFATFVHVTNVSGYTVLLARELGFRDRGELEKIAVGALLHDVGKRLIPNEILSKPSGLDPSEREIINMHPQLGYEELCGRDDLELGQLMMVYQHHEHLDGNGYPVGILADEIHPWSKLLSVVDVFDALTGKRPYRRSATRAEALEFLQERANAQFDEEMVKCWVSLMQQMS